MSPSAFLCLFIDYLPLLFVLYFTNACQAWLPDSSTKLSNSINKISSISFKGNSSFLDHFTVLYQDDNTFLLGGRNKVYNLSVFDFLERKESSIFWPSSDAHSKLCLVKGKSEDDCQNYIRLMYQTDAGKFFICGTNSYKPLCRHYIQKNGKYTDSGNDVEGIGLCPYDPDHNSTSVYSNGHLFSATAADFSGSEPIIYREPLRTEQSDLKQLNAPNFVSSVIHGDYIYFFFRETAVEFMNCGKVIYSRVARVCKHDKGGPHQSRDKWTTFTKARLNCSVPGEYPFYFDEIQSTSEIVEVKNGENTSKLIYSALTTPDNAIGGSAICVFSMDDVEQTFKGPFKHQESINSNWLPVPENKVPEPRPGQCAKESRILPDKNVNFIKTHPLMENAVPSLYGRPILIRVSLHYRFTSVAVDPQVRTVNDKTFDVIYIGTDDGKILKVVNIQTENSAKAFVISENEVFPKGTPVKQLKIAPGYGKVVAVSVGEVKMVSLNHCANINRCSDCIELRDPHCAWDSIKAACVSVDIATSLRYLLQDVSRGDSSRCKTPPTAKTVLEQEIDNNEVLSNSVEDIDSNASDSLSRVNDILSTDCNDVNSDIKTGCSVQRKLEYTSETFHIFVVVAGVGGLLVGFFCGYLVSRRFHMPSQYPNSPFIEQHNHLDRLNVNQNSFLGRPNKTVNLDVLNVSSDTLPPKKDNLGSLKNLNIASEGTLQKIKKTYI